MLVYCQSLYMVICVYSNLCNIKKKMRKANKLAKKFYLFSFAIKIRF